MYNYVYIYIYTLDVRCIALKSRKRNASQHISSHSLFLLPLRIGSQPAPSRTVLWYAVQVLSWHSNTGQIHTPAQTPCSLQLWEDTIGWSVAHSGKPRHSRQRHIARWLQQHDLRQLPPPQVLCDDLPMRFEVRKETHCAFPESAESEVNSWQPRERCGKAQIFIQHWQALCGKRFDTQCERLLKVLVRQQLEREQRRQCCTVVDSSHLLSFGGSHLLPHWRLRQNRVVAAFHLQRTGIKSVLTHDVRDVRNEREAKTLEPLARVQLPKSQHEGFLKDIKRAKGGSLRTCHILQHHTAGNSRL